MHIIAHSERRPNCNSDQRSRADASGTALGDIGGIIVFVGANLVLLVTMMMAMIGFSGTYPPRQRRGSASEER
jgi:hypothetical protein